MVRGDHVTAWLECRADLSWGQLGGQRGERVGAPEGHRGSPAGTQLRRRWMEVGSRQERASPVHTGAGPSLCLTRALRLVPSPIPHAHLSPDGSRCHGLRWRRCRSPRSDSRSQELGGADTATVSEGTAEDGCWGLGPRGGEVGLGTQTPGSGPLIRASGGGWGWPRVSAAVRARDFLHPHVFLGAQMSMLRRSGAGEMGFVGPHMIRDRVELLPVPGAGHGCRQLPGRGGERPRPSRHLGSQPPGPAARRVSSWVAGVGKR